MKSIEAADNAWMMSSAARGLTLALVGTAAGGVHAAPPEVTVQHLSTVFGGQGLCAVRFALETAVGQGDAGTVSLELSFVDSKRQELARGRIEAELTDTATGRYQEAHVDGKDLCLDGEVTVVIRRARSELRGKQFDLIKLKKVRASDFRPYRIIVR